MEQNTSRFCCTTQSRTQLSITICGIFNFMFLFPDWPRAMKTTERKVTDKPGLLYSWYLDFGQLGSWGCYSSVPGHHIVFMCYVSLIFFGSSAFIYFCNFESFEGYCLHCRMSFNLVLPVSLLLDQVNGVWAESHWESLPLFMTPFIRHHFSLVMEASLFDEIGLCMSLH